MEVFGHDDVPHDDKAVALPSFFENGKEAIAAASCTELRPPLIARAGDKVQVMGAVSAVESGGHEGHGTSDSGTRPCKERKDGAPHVSEWDGGIKVKGGPPAKVTFVTFDLDQMKKDFKSAQSPSAERAGTTAHEGAIAADQKANGQPASREAIAREEHAANTAESVVHQGLGTRSAAGLWDPNWDPIMAPTYRDNAIDNLTNLGTNLVCQNNPDCR